MKIMPKTEGAIPRKILPIFVIIQELGDERGTIYRLIIDKVQ